MVGQISHLAGQELAQIARKKRGPFQRSHAAPQSRADKGAAIIRSAKSSAAPHHHKSAAIRTSLKPELPRNYNIEVPVPVATLIGDAVSTKTTAQTSAARISAPGTSATQISNGHPAGGLSLLTLQDVAQHDEQTTLIDRQTKSRGHGLALGHDKRQGTRPAHGEKPERAPELISADNPRRTDNSDPANFIKRYQHRDFNAEAALNLLSDGQEQARDASLSVKFKAYAESATESSQDQRFVQQLLNGAERV